MLNKIIKSLINLVIFGMLLFCNLLMGKNILENSSFEVGSGHGWGIASSNKIVGPLSLVDYTSGFDGTASLRLGFSQSVSNVIISKIYRLNSSKQYTFSLYIKSTLPDVWFMVYLRNVFTGEKIDPGVFSNPGNNWKRISFSFQTTSNMDQSSYQIYIEPYNGNRPGQYVWVDAIQLEEGILSDYKPISSIELGVDFQDRLDHIFFIDEEVNLNLRQYNSSTSSKSVEIQYELYDFFNNVVDEGNLNNSIPPNSTRIDVLNFSTDVTGVYRLLTWVEDIDITLEESIFSVLKRPNNLGVDENSMFGAHIPPIEYFVKTLQKIGVKWNRSLSTGKQFRWELIEPSKGNFIWKDDELILYEKYGIKTLGVIGSELVFVPAWADSSGMGHPSIADWGDFVYNVVNHYKDLVDYWEIWNEPEGEGGLNNQEEFYARLLKKAYIEAKRADPNCKIVGLVTNNNGYARGVDDAFGGNGNCQNFLDIVSHHFYPEYTYGGAYTMNDYFWTPRNITVPKWNSECGTFSKSFYQTFLHEDLPKGVFDYKNALDMFAQAIANTIGQGMTNFFYYDARETAAPDEPGSYSLFDIDQTLKPMSIGYSVIIKIFDHSKAFGDYGDDDYHAWGFQKGDSALAIVFTKERDVVKSISTNALVYDVMGNRIQGEIKFGYTPIYLIETGITVEQMLTNSVISSSSDIDPPNLSLVTYPTGPTNVDRITFRWFAIDDNTWTIKGDGKLIEYSYMFENYDNNWSSWDGTNITNLSKTYYDVPEGEYVFKVKARDAAGNESEEKSVNVSVVDLSPEPPQNLRVLK